MPDRLSELDARLTALEATVRQLAERRGFQESPDRLPYFLASPIARAKALHGSSAQFFGLLDVGEATIKYSAALALSAARSQGLLVNEIDDLFRVPPSLGKWAEGLRLVTENASVTAWPVPELRDAFRKPNGKPTSVARYLLAEFIRLRNDERGHGAQQPEGYYEGLFLKNDMILTDSIAQSTHLKIEVVTIHGAEPHETIFRYKVRQLTGQTPSILASPLESTVPVPLGSTCIWDGDSVLLPIDTFATYRFCDICGAEHGFFAERIVPERIHYHSHVGNHRISVQRLQ